MINFQPQIKRIRYTIARPAKNNGFTWGSTKSSKSFAHAKRSKCCASFVAMGGRGSASEVIVLSAEGRILAKMIPHRMHSKFRSACSNLHLGQIIAHHPAPESRGAEQIRKGFSNLLLIHGERNRRKRQRKDRQGAPSDPDPRPA